MFGITITNVYLIMVCFILCNMKPVVELIQLAIQKKKHNAYAHTISYMIALCIISALMFVILFIITYLTNINDNVTILNFIGFNIPTISFLGYFAIMYLVNRGIHKEANRMILIILNEEN